LENELREESLTSNAASSPIRQNPIVPPFTLQQLPLRSDIAAPLPICSSGSSARQRIFCAKTMCPIFSAQGMCQERVAQDIHQMWAFLCLLPALCKSYNIG